MPQRRKPSMHHIPAYEDAGLFKNTVSPIDVELVPQMQRNARQDLVVRGFLQDRSIDVVFAGRRAKQVAPLETHLSAMVAHARRWAQGQGLGKSVDVESLRLPLRIEGAFRPKFSRDVSGWETRAYQIMVSRWTMIDAVGNITVFGTQPVISAAKTPR
ncbi:hypothetical protein [Ascidiaceihabitans sp.]|uniref:hypothetical protein n=1 Tax=Ascidiaceihabitans sp. TaxID=1872644 RepID=UPI003299DD61